MSVFLQTVTEDEADIRLDRWFRRHFPHLTQGALQKLCRTGQVRVDGKRVDPATRLASGQGIRIPPMPDASRPAPLLPAIDPHDRKELERLTVYQDECLIVLDKPAGLPVQGGPGIKRHLDGMLAALRDETGNKPRLVHRLDRDTSGLIVLARTPGVAAKLAAAFRGRAVKKTYWAIVVGRPSPAEGQIDLRLARIGAGAGALTVPAERDEEDAVSAVTDYRTLDHAGRKFTWLEMQPLTGRTHQLRVHCEALKTPILGDPKYGGDAAHPDGFVDRLHLHARALDLPHPQGGRLLVHAPAPPHLKETLKSLGFTEPAAPGPARQAGRD